MGASSKLRNHKVKNLKFCKLLEFPLLMHLKVGLKKKRTLAKKQIGLAQKRDIPLFQGIVRKRHKMLMISHH